MLRFSDDSVPLPMAASVRRAFPKLQLLLVSSNDAPSLMPAGYPRLFPDASLFLVVFLNPIALIISLIIV